MALLAMMNIVFLSAAVNTWNHRKYKKKIFKRSLYKNNTIDRNFKYSYITRGFWTLLEVDC